MFLLCIAAALVVIFTYIGCRAKVVSYLMVECPALVSDAKGRPLSGPWFEGITLSDPLLEKIDASSSEIPETSPVWRYIKTMRACVVLLVLVGVAALFALPLSL